jgi:heme/copper-type cytochrome/quinol oxidase subunit 3
MSVASEAVGHPAGGGHVDRPTKLRGFRIAVLLLILSDVVFMGGLFFAYAYLRALNPNQMWLPASVHAPGIATGWVIAGLMVVSAAVWRWGDLGGRAGQYGRLSAGAWMAVLLVLAEFVVQVQQLAAASFAPNAGGFASAFYGLNGYHAVHLVLLLTLGVGVAIRAGRGVYKRGAYNEAALIGYVWYYVAVSAVGMALLPH